MNQSTAEPQKVQVVQRGTPERHLLSPINVILQTTCRTCHSGVGRVGPRQGFTSAPRAASATFSQELIDRILGDTDKDTLKSIPALQRLANLLSASPHLALHVRTLRLVQPSFYAPCVWMQLDILPVILPLFTHLASLKISIYNWDFFHSDFPWAQLSSIELEEARFQTNVKLLAFLQCYPTSLQFASLRHVYTHRSNLNDASIEFDPLHLTSLHIDSHASAPYHWAMRAVDPKHLRDLQTDAQKSTLKFVQRLLDGAVHVETYHISLRDSFYRRASYSQIRHSDDWERFLDYPLRDHPLEGFGERHPALRDVVVRIVFRHEPPALQQGIQYLKELFHRLENRGILTAVWQIGERSVSSAGCTPRAFRVRRPIRRIRQSSSCLPWSSEDHKLIGFSPDSLGYYIALGSWPPKGFGPNLDLTAGLFPGILATLEIPLLEANEGPHRLP
ncbi:hypothetical protein C8F04DRAFT_1241972 [Mycena alexandri]|uniref:Uncharacterized protein n=1 Tax=Mycena alexandri TaxID=1745969 RepID=A0AAD6S412_9AGAR|nr:hypothetical protein C8F04DRAFT_1241972 [Mycena alexandri]